jgi:hypothetical protein
VAHTDYVRVTAGSEVIGMNCSVTENGGVVRIYVPDNEAQRYRTYGSMRFEERREVGGTTIYRGWYNGKMVSWNVTPNPCRSCK